MVFCSGHGYHGGAGKKLIDAVAWAYGKDKKGYCDTCRAAAKKKKRQPNCTECSKAKPVLWPQNVDIYDCLMFCERQLRAGFGGPYALDFIALARVADDMGITTDREFWSMIWACEKIITGSYTKETQKVVTNGR
jgi:hypothetical protein